MSACAVSSDPSNPGTKTPQGIEQTVQLVLCGTRPTQPVFERRRAMRHPFPYPVRLSPLASDGSPLLDASVFAVGKHLSHQGLDFYTGQPLPFRRAIACFDGGHGPSVRLLIDLTWCRFCHHGWYENGGRFLPPMQVAETALETLVAALA